MTIPPREKASSGVAESGPAASWRVTPPGRNTDTLKGEKL